MQTAGAFVRRKAAFRGWADIASGPGRYHLYVAPACPWSHRTIIVRRLKGLEDDLSVSLAYPYRDERGWRLRDDEVNGFTHLREAYEAARPGYDDRISVPVLWDREEETIVNNESTDIVRMLNDWGDPAVDLYPPDLRAEIDDLDDWVYGGFQNSVYRAGFSRSQEAYDEAFASVFATMERLERLLGERRYLAGHRITLADWRLFPTLVRFDVVYHYHFKCNLRRLRDYPNLWAYTRDLYQYPGVAPTVDLAQIKEHYYRSQTWVNPSGVVPLGPVLDEKDFNEPHAREGLTR